MDGSQTYLKPKNGSGAQVTQAFAGAEPPRDEPPDALVEVHPQPTLGGKRGSIGYTVLPRCREGSLIGAAAGIPEKPVSLTTIPKIPRRRKEAKPLKNPAASLLESLLPRRRQKTHGGGKHARPALSGSHFNKKQRFHFKESH